MTSYVTPELLDALAFEADGPAGVFSIRQEQMKSRAPDPDLLQDLDDEAVRTYPDWREEVESRKGNAEEQLWRLAEGPAPTESTEDSHLPAAIPVDESDNYQAVLDYIKNLAFATARLSHRRDMMIAVAAGLPGLTENTIAAAAGVSRSTINRIANQRTQQVDWAQEALARAKNGPAIIAFKETVAAMDIPPQEKLALLQTFYASHHPPARDGADDRLGECP